MATKYVTGKVTNPDGTAAALATVRVTLSQAAYIPGTQEVVPALIPATAGSDGTYTFQAQANNDLTPTGTYYNVVESGPGFNYTYTIVIPQTNDGHGKDGSSIANAMVITWLMTNTPTASPTPSHVSTLTVDGQATFTAGPVIIGADPGGGQLLRVGGTGHFSGALTLDAGATISGPVSITAGTSTTASSLSLSYTTDNTKGPTLGFNGLNGRWQIGLDISNAPGNRDLVLVAKIDFPAVGNINDFVYVAHGGVNAPTLGIGVTPPTTGANSYRLQVQGDSGTASQGTLQLVVNNPGQTGSPFAIVQGAAPFGTLFQIDATGGVVTPLNLKGATPALQLAGVNFLRSLAANVARFNIPATGGAIQFNNAADTAAIFTLNDSTAAVLANGLTISAGGASITGALTVNGNIGFYNTSPVAKQTVTGSKGANAALTSLMAALVAMGLVTDSTT